MQKVKTVLNKSKFVLEFILSAIFVITLFRLIIVKGTKEYWDVGQLVIACVAGILLLALIIYIIKKEKKVLEKIVISILIPVGMMYVFFVVPTRVPDETSHIVRAVEVSNGLSIKGESKAKIQKCYKDIFSIDNYEQVGELIEKGADYNGGLESFDNVANGNLSVAYILSALAFKIGRLFSMSCLSAVYLGRLFNYIFFLCVVYISIKRIPFGKLIVAVISFLPMILQQCGSISADSLIISLSLFFVSYSLYLRFTEDKLKKYQYFIYILSGILLTPLKFVYIPIVCISLILVLNKNIAKKTKKIVIPIAIILPILLSIGWYMFTVGGSLTDDANRSNSFVVGDEVIKPNSSEQLSFIIHNPIGYLKNLAKCVYNMENYLLTGATVSPLGWLNININSIIVYIFIFILLISPFIENNKSELRKREKALILLIFVGTSLLILTVYYLVGANVGGDRIFGCQGRYFIPVMILPLLCMSRKENYFRINRINVILPIVLMILNTVVVQAVISNYI